MDIEIDMLCSYNSWTIGWQYQCITMCQASVWLNSKLKLAWLKLHFSKRSLLKRTDQLFVKIAGINPWPTQNVMICWLPTENDDINFYYCIIYRYMYHTCQLLLKQEMQWSDLCSCEEKWSFIEAPKDLSHWPLQHQWFKPHILRLQQDSHPSPFQYCYWDTVMFPILVYDLKREWGSYWSQGIYQGQGTYYA